MSTRVALAAVVISMLTLDGPAFGVSVATAAPSVHGAAAATSRVVIRPVTTAGEPAPGVEVATDSHAGSVDCSRANPSPGAVSRDVEFCSPSAAYAVACWKSATPKHVLCSRDPSSNRVYLIRHTGRFAATRLAPKRNRAPLRLVLGNGTVCLIRDGGAWSSLKAHPRWYGTYSCDSNKEAVWSPQNAPHSGINETRPSWTVHVAPISGNGHVTLRRVRRAYFVGTHS